MTTGRGPSASQGRRTTTRAATAATSTLRRLFPLTCAGTVVAFVSLLMLLIDLRRSVIQMDVGGMGRRQAVSLRLLLLQLGPVRSSWILKGVVASRASRSSVLVVEAVRTAIIAGDVVGVMIRVVPAVMASAASATAASAVLRLLILLLTLV